MSCQSLFQEKVFFRGFLSTNIFIQQQVHLIGKKDYLIRFI